MAIDFPNSPSVNDEFVAGGRTWKWTGTTWDLVAGSGTAYTYTVTVGDGVNNVFTISHGLSSRDVFVTAREATAPYDTVDFLWSATTTDAITVDFSTVPAVSSIVVNISSSVAGPVTTPTDLDSLSDVTISSPTLNDTLSYNGSTWVNQPAVDKQTADDKLMAVITMDIGA